jgi:hypothetical protein
MDLKLIPGALFFTVSGSVTEGIVQLKWGQAVVLFLSKTLKSILTLSYLKHILK